ncbi:tetratricopeptide repeat protein [Rubellicoccus peritrichatus]|uniref:Tetratricopeptide repeat protein n=1 Tax=Rubellicoccus peritrichatus TaxID=3080537 RepID=A0AAQ3LAX6_9BACT|nr:tetratricopeptide repeat protein [Puniceicoccus sp. CR14]WOO42351.1 tetratricopeptide repeat protein [Puniceicoccus sp. CR14]
MDLSRPDLRMPKWVVFTTGLLLFWIQGFAQKTPVTMEALLQQGVTAFSAGNYAQAAEAFARLESEFGKEHQYKPLPRTLLPIWGYAAAQSDDGPKAIELFERFLKEYPDEIQRQAFVLYSLAQAYHSSGQINEAIEVYQRFIEKSPDSPEAILSAMRQSDLYFELDENEKGIERLVGFSESEKVPPSLQAQARLRAIQKAQEIGDEAQAAELLLSRNWSINAMPELAVLSFSALRAGDFLMKEKRIEDAILVYRLVPPLKQLITVQQEKLRTLQNANAERQSLASVGLQNDAIWNDYYRNLIAQVAGGLEVLKSEDDYTPAMQLRLGQGFLLVGRNREAYLLYEALAEDETLEEDLRSQAHYRWILSANALEDWDDALVIARSFLDRYPGNPLAPEALYLIANAYHEQMRYEDAVSVLNDLLDHYPGHRLASRWLFSRGFNKTLSDDFKGARIDFEAYIADNPKGFQLADSRLWNGLTWFLEKNYDTALEEFDTAMQSIPSGHHVYPEIEYRRASTLYSKRDYDEALPAIDAFIEKYPKHKRTPEARVLRGDILMGQGRLLEASNAFHRVSPEAEGLYTYAVFQRGKIMRALEEYDLMIEHFQEYVDSEDVPQKVRVAEALYWIGWAYSQQDRRQDAFPAFVDALERYGDDPLAGETEQILQALQKLHRQYQQGETLLEAQTTKGNELLAAEDFQDYLIGERKRALDAKELTWFSRLSSYLAKVETKRKNHDRANAYLWETIEKVPTDKLDADGLARLGLLLQGEGYETSREYFDRLIDAFPGRPQTGAAYYGLANLAVRDEDLITAARWLQQFREETPLHPLSPEATLLQAQVLTDSGRSEDAVDVLEDLLRLKSARGRPHARALAGIANAYESAHDPQKAIAYYQRIYTVYRAYPDLLAPAYIRSAQLFEELGEPQSAYNTYREMIADERLKDFEEYTIALEQAERLAKTLPPEIPEEPASQSEEAA